MNQSKFFSIRFLSGYAVIYYHSLCVMGDVAVFFYYTYYRIYYDDDNALKVCFFFHNEIVVKIWCNRYFKTELHIIGSDK